MNKYKAVIGFLSVLLFSSAVLANPNKSKVKNIVLKESNLLTLMDEVNGETVGSVLDQVKQINAKSKLTLLFGNKNKEPLYLFLRTPGGSVQAGLEMFEGLKGLDRRVDTITMFAASMGFQTVQQLGKRYIVKNGILMSHRASGSFRGEFGGLKPSQMDSRKNLWESRIEEMDNHTVKRTNGKQTLESYQKAYAPELWLTGSQAVEQGYADEIVIVSCDSSLGGYTSHEVTFMGFIDISYDLDKCPLNSSPMNVKIKKISTNKGYMSMEDFYAKNGGFGVECYQRIGTNSNQVCASDLSITREFILNINTKFKTYYNNIESRVLPYKID